MALKRRLPILWNLIALLVGLFAPGAWAQLPSGGAQSFTFVALGDMPYRIPGDYEKVDRLIAAINRTKPAFSIHIGDVKSGSTPCSDALLTRSFEQLQTFEQPLVYTPGDNEWTDCHREKAGRYDPRERLTKVRSIFFPQPGQSLGKSPMSVETQSRLDPKFWAYVENQRFRHNDVVFVAVHVVGSNNGFEPRDPGAAAEFFARNEANVAWIGDGFRVAAETKAKAIVIAFQADLFDITQKYPAMPSSSGFIDIVKAIEQGAKTFGKPALVLHGDAHELEITGFRDTKLKLVPNIIRLQVMGAEQVHAVRVLVDPDDPAVFGFFPLIVPENGPF